MTKIKFDNQEYDLKLNYYLVSITLPDKFQININTILSIDNPGDILQRLTFDDDLGLRMFYFFLTEQNDLYLTYEEFLKQVDGAQLGKFREDFWAEVVNFSDPLKKKILIDLWREYIREVKKSSVKEALDSSSSSSSPGESEKKPSTP